MPVAAAGATGPRRCGQPDGARGASAGRSALVGLGCVGSPSRRRSTCHHATAPRPPPRRQARPVGAPGGTSALATSAARGVSVGRVRQWRPVGGPGLGAQCLAGWPRRERGESGIAASACRDSACARPVRQSVGPGRASRARRAVHSRRAASRPSLPSPRRRSPRRRSGPGPSNRGARNRRASRRRSRSEPEVSLRPADGCACPGRPHLHRPARPAHARASRPRVASASPSRSSTVSARTLSPRGLSPHGLSPDGLSPHGLSRAGRGQAGRRLDQQPSSSAERTSWQGQAMTGPLARPPAEPERQVPFWLRPMRRK